jgi:hypothetical protein
MTTIRSALLPALAVLLGGALRSNAASAPAASAPTGDRFLYLPADSLKFEGDKPTAVGNPESFDTMWETPPEPYVVLDVAGEAFVDLPEEWGWWNLPSLANTTVAIRAEQGSTITGRLFIPSGADPFTLKPFRFSVPEGVSDSEPRDKYFRTVERYYERLLDRGLPGAAWFRHRLMEARAQRSDVANGAQPEFDVRLPMRPTDLDQTYDLFSGGRALSENLQLDRLVEPNSKEELEPIDIATIAGITTKELDWKALVKDLHPELDPLAALVPFDQHAIFFGTFGAMTRVLDEADANGTPLLELMTANSRDQMTQLRTERQLCLPLSTLGRALGPIVVSSVAITGSDPEWVEGSDLALLFECKQPGLLTAWIASRHAEAVAAGAKASEDELAGAPPVHWRGASTTDNRVRSYFAELPTAVVVSNSLAQLERVISTAKGATPTLASQNEYVFFRDRYPRKDAEESALVVLTDAAIRRWCSPRWRIGSSRRRRAAAAMAELQARRVDALASAANLPDEPAFDAHLPLSEDFVWRGSKLQSPTYGSLEFRTPILELDLRTVTQAEKAAYERFRDRYQSNWRAFFDPIALRLGVTDERLSADLTVMPLIAGTEYRSMIDATQGKVLPPLACDPHPEALLHLALAFNAESETGRMFNGLAGQMGAKLGADPLAWMGAGVGFYAEADPFWGEWIHDEHRGQFIQDNVHRLPLAMHVEVKDPLKLAAFLTALRLYSQEAAPNLTVWENRTYQDVTYVRLAAADNVDLEGGFGEIALYYAALPDALILTLREDLLQRAIDRRAARKNPKTHDSAQPWLGDNVALSAQVGVVDLLEAVGGQAWSHRMETAAWANLPILNEWKRRFPDQDPLAVHERLWRERLLCPAGGGYAWNAELHTMESKLYGNPAAPKPGPKHPKVLERALSAGFGLTFEKDGLRARGQLLRKAQ